MIGSSSSSRRSGFQRILVVALAIASVLVGLVALHTLAGTQDGVVAASAVVKAIDTAPEASRLAAMEETAIQSVTALASMCAEGVCDIGCAVIASSCMLLVVLFGLVALARFPVVIRWFQHALRAIQSAAAARSHVYLPSLTELAISRT